VEETQEEKNDRRVEEGDVKGWKKISRGHYREGGEKLIDADQKTERKGLLGVECGMTQGEERQLGGPGSRWGLTINWGKDNGRFL